MLMTRHRISFFTCVLLSTALFTSAGPNRQSTIQLDFDAKTTVIDSPVLSITNGSSSVISIIMGNLISLHSYSIKITYDPDIVRFDGAQKSLFIRETSVLESKGGSIAAFLAIPGPGSVEIAVTQAGKVKSATASGSGIAACMKFTALKNGDPKIRVTEALLVNENGEVDSCKVGNVNQEQPR